MPSARSEHSATGASLLARAGEPSGMLVFGGVHLYDIARNTWIQPAPVSTSQRPGGRDGHVMAILGETAYVYGGVNAQGEKLSDLWSFNVYAAVSGYLRWTQP